MRSCIGNRLLSSGEKDEAELVAHTESDSDLMDMLARAATDIGLEWNPPPCLERSRLDDWFLRAARSFQQSSAPLPSQKCMRRFSSCGRHLSHPKASATHTTLDSGAFKGYVEIPQVESAIAVHLCPQGAAT